MGITYNPRVVTDGLVLCLDAANKRSYPGTGTVWTDLAGGNNGTLTNGPTFSSDNGGVMEFDGTDDRIEQNGLGLSFTDFSIGAIIKPVGNDGNHNAVITTTLGTNSDYQYGLTWDLGNSSGSSYDNMNLEISRSFGGFINSSAFNSSFPFGTWTHIALTVDSVNNNYKVYVNGNQDYTNSYNGTITHFDRITIGQRYCCGGYQGSGTWNGSIAAVQIYNRALTAAEVLQNYNATRGRFQ